MTSPSPSARGPRALLRELFAFRLPDGAGWGHVLGGLLLTLFAVQLVTGVLLATYYSPTPATAWESVEYIETRVAAGSLIRGLHHFSSSAFVVLVLLHALRVFFSAAYKRPRQWTWVVGVLLGTCVLAFAVSGYLLPWDRMGYFGTVIISESIGTLPWVGEALRRLALGGREIGAATLSRFFALHVVALPLITAGLIGFHLFQVRALGIAPRDTSKATSKAPRSGDASGSRRFFPHQVARDLGVGLALVLGLLALAHFVGAPLEAKADPLDTSYVPRSEWFLLGGQQLLRAFPGETASLVLTLLPVLVLLTLLALPWIDRNPSRTARERKVPIALGVIALLSGSGVTSWGWSSARLEEQRMAERLRSQDRALQIDVESDPGEPAEATGAAVDEEALVLGETLYETLACASCHEGERDHEGFVVPSLAWIGSRVTEEWLVDYMLDPAPMRYLFDGERPRVRMPDYQLRLPEAKALALFLSQQTDRVAVPHRDLTGSGSSDRIERGRALVEAHQCRACHVVDGEGHRIGPSLDHSARRLHPAFTVAMTLEPQRLVPGTSMYASELSEEDAVAVAQYLHSIEGGDSQ